ncbi:MAG TPA: hypothetical protein VJ837_03135, partial [Candidatus Paceibacterota bacterium]|nr:hypothetical protein [Candidatus Paceibacterota bacterium]
ADNSQKWRTRLSPREHRLFEGVAGSLLDCYGYERVARDARSPRRVEGLYWSADNLIRRARTDGYWEDTLYRMSLRLGAMGSLFRTFGNRRTSR